MEIVEEFGIQPILLIAQVFNFLLLLFILKRFLYKPIIGVLDERKAKISESIKNSQEIEKTLEQITKEREEKLAEAARQAQVIIKQASEAADEIVARAHTQAAEDIKRMVERARLEMAAEKDDLNRQIRRGLAELVGQSLTRVTGKILTDKDQKDLIKRTVNSL